MNQQTELPTPSCNPLTDEHCQLLDVALQACDLQDELLGKCTAAGMPALENYYRENKRARQMALGYKQAFFPERP